MKSKDIIIIEDTATMLLGMEETLRREGFRVQGYEDPEAALQAFRRKPAPLVISDLKMEPLDGIEVLMQVKEFHPRTEVIMVSAYGTVEAAVKAMQYGAADFITKPFSTEELRVRVQKVWEKIQQKDAFSQLAAEKELLEENLFGEMVGESPAMQQVFQLIQRVAREDSTILIEGESGTGKELVARAIHRQSLRAHKPFIPINCGALNDNLLESELFGHEKGAFTGAIRRKRGRFELADSGTLFLDEIGDISPAMQVKLLRAVEQQTFERVGGEETITVDVRIICATHRNLLEEVEKGNFREDLYYRLSVIPVRLPPLRQRKEDIPALVQHFLKKQRGESAKHISPQGMMLLQQYSWPGNIRELENVIERLQILSPTDEIPPELIAEQLGSRIRGNPAHYENLPLEEAVGSFEKNLIARALKQSGGNKNQAAKLLGVKTSTLYYKLEKYGLL